MKYVTNIRTKNIFFSFMILNIRFQVTPYSVKALRKRAEIGS